MQGLIPIFAEVWDKEPAMSTIYALAISFSLVCFFLSLWRPWGIMMALIIAAFFDFITVGWLQDPNEGPEILRELGQSYVRHAYISGFIPTLAVIVGIVFGIMIRKPKLAQP